MGSEAWHEPYESLSPETRDLHRAIVSLMEELEAVDWYNQRANITTDADLKAVLEHNRDEEIEHAMMTLEWIRRRNAKFDENIRTYIFSEGPITEVEEAATGGESDEGSIEKKKGAPERSAPAKASSNDGSLGIRGLSRPGGA